MLTYFHSLLILLFSPPSVCFVFILVRVISQLDKVSDANDKLFKSSNDLANAQQQTNSKALLAPPKDLVSESLADVGNVYSCKDARRSQYLTVRDKEKSPKEDKTIPVRTTETNNRSKASLLSLVHEASEREVREGCQEGRHPRDEDNIDSADVFPHSAELNIATTTKLDKVLGKEHDRFVNTIRSSCSESSSSSSSSTWMAEWMFRRRVA